MSANSSAEATSAVPSPAELIAGHARAMAQTLGYTGICKCCGDPLSTHAHRISGVAGAEGPHEYYYGSTLREDPSVPSGPGLIIDSRTGVVVRGLGGMWQQGKLVKQAQVWRGALPPDTPLPRKGQVANKEMQSGFCVFDSSTVDENTLAHGSGTWHLADGVAFTGGTWERGVLQHGFVLTNEPGRRGRYDGPFVRDSPDSYAASPLGIGAIRFADFGEIYLGAVDGRQSKAFPAWRHGLGIILAIEGHPSQPAGKLLAAGQFEHGELALARGVRPSDLPRADQPGGEMLSPLARQATLIWHADGLYTGDLDHDGYASGKGVHTHADGRPFGDGTFWRNALHGEGGRTWPDGASYRGEYAVGLKHGRGCYLQPDGSGYDGQWESDKRCGYAMTWTAGGTVSFERRHSPDDDEVPAAVPRRFLFHHDVNTRLSVGQLKADLLYPSGGWYIGDLDSHFRQHGQGASYDKDGTLVAEGDWKEGKLSFTDQTGKACTLNNLGVKRDVASGGEAAPSEDEEEKEEEPSSFLSTFEWADGRYFEGRVAYLLPDGVEDAEPVLLPHGYGACWSPSGEIIVVGMWNCGRPVSQGPIPISYCLNGRFLTPDQRKATLLLPHGGHYTGQYHPVSRRPHGPAGRAVESDGVVSDGAWVEGQLHGRASQTIVFPGGVFRYDGDWVHGGREGLGTIVLEGVTWTGQMVDHCQKGYGAQWDSDGRITACGRWTQGDPDTPAVLVHACPVPLRFLPERKFLPAHGAEVASDQSMSLHLCPNGTIEERKEEQEEEEGEEDQGDSAANEEALQGSSSSAVAEA